MQGGEQPDLAAPGAVGEPAPAGLEDAVLGAGERLRGGASGAGGEAGAEDSMARGLERLPDGVEGAIIGTALYEGRFTLEEALALTKGSK